MRKLSRSPLFQRVNVSANSSLLRPPTTRSTSYASLISCMSPYSMPLCTILTKLPLPPGPMCMTHGPSSTCAATFVTIGSMNLYASASPPGIIDGPLRAPSSPPDTPMPMYRMPFSATFLARRSVFSYHSLPPSMMQSPSSRCSIKRSMVASTGFPAITSMITRLGFSRDCTKSSMVSYPCNFSPRPDFFARATAASVFA
mmetsp:Transcript_19856/g.59972  ORF Transcript_19856/g.59972 Transcript_19856/m.59972 type:complete len:200 (+) Transcript_19856:1212-1811(+)